MAYNNFLKVTYWPCTSFLKNILWFLSFSSLLDFFSWLPGKVAKKSKSSMFALETLFPNIWAILKAFVTRKLQPFDETSWIYAMYVCFWGGFVFCFHWQTENHPKEIHPFSIVYPLSNQPYLGGGINPWSWWTHWLRDASFSTKHCQNSTSLAHSEKAAKEICFSLQDSNQWNSREHVSWHELFPRMYRIYC